MADDSDSLLREVDDELRREQMQKFWERYNGLILAAVAAVLIGVGGYKFWETRRTATAQAAGAEFSAAEDLAENKKSEDAQKAFTKIAETGPAGYAVLAKFQVAGAAAKAGKTADALAIYEDLAKNAAGDGLLKNYAQLQAASLRLADADYAEILSRLTPLAGDGAPFAGTAKELLGLAAIKAKKLDDARKYLEPLLIDPDASQTVQDRIKVLMGEIAAAELAKDPSVKAAQPAAAAPAAAAATPAAAPQAATTGGQPADAKKSDAAAPAAEPSGKK